VFFAAALAAAPRAGPGKEPARAKIKEADLHILKKRLRVSVMSQEKGTFVVAGEKAQVAADYTAEKVCAAGTYISESASAAGTYVADKATAAKDSVTSATQSAEHNTANALRAAGDKIDPEVQK
jgi:hypothetical protein